MAQSNSLIAAQIHFIVSMPSSGSRKRLSSFRMIAVAMLPFWPECSDDVLTRLLCSQDDRLSLIHIPLKGYTTYVQPLLQLLHPAKANGAHREPDDDLHSAVPWATQYPFLNVSITPIECSVVCSKALAQEYFAPVIAQTSSGRESKGDRATISAEDFVVISVEGEGLDAGQRVLELTSPLALAGM